MKLYFAPNACSLSPHIVLQETGLPFTLEKVSLGSKKTASGEDFNRINPKGSVPALETDDGELLTEGPAIVQYLADRAPQAGLTPAAGTLAHYRLIEWLNFISTELHKGFTPLFNPAAPQETKQAARDHLAKRIGFVAERLPASGFLMGEQFTVADAYLFTVLRWSVPVKFDLQRWPGIEAYMQRVGERPAVRAALAAEAA